MLTVVYPKPDQIINDEKTFIMGQHQSPDVLLIDHQPVYKSESGYFCFPVNLQVGQNTFNVAGQNIVIERSQAITFEQWIENSFNNNPKLIYPLYNDVYSFNQQIYLYTLAPVHSVVMAIVGEESYQCHPIRFDTRETCFGFLSYLQPPYESGLALFQCSVLTTNFKEDQRIEVSYKVTTQNGKTTSLKPPGSFIVTQKVYGFKVKEPDTITRNHPINGTRQTPLLQGTQFDVEQQLNGWGKIKNYPLWVQLQALESIDSFPQAELSAIHSGLSAKWITIDFTLSDYPVCNIDAQNNQLTLTLVDTKNRCDYLSLKDDVQSLGIEHIELKSLDGYHLQVILHLNSQLMGHKFEYDAKTSLLKFSIKTVASLKNALAHGQLFNIVLDAGHGGDELGAIAPNGVAEKNYNLELTECLLGLLRESAQAYPYKITCTRLQDESVSLQDRVHIAEKAEADLFISLHHNALPDSANPTEHNGVCSLYTTSFSQPVARTLLEQLVEHTAFDSYGVIQNSLYVCRQSICPSILLELGFYTFPDDAEKCLSLEHQGLMVKALQFGINAVFDSVMV